LPSDPAEIPRAERLRVTEVYASVQGESTHAGKPCVFVRLTGCNLRCVWCDSAYTFTGGTARRLSDVIDEAHGYGIPTIEITGGEPLLQPNAIPLMQRLIDLGHEVLLETSGSLSIREVPDGVHVILDLKPPDSGEVEANLWENLGLLDAEDEVKIVLASRRDYEWARGVIEERRLAERCTVLLSPAWGAVDPRDLVAWILEDHLPVRLNLQIHKFVWGPDRTGV
jgi:7-carboxy-7-deazaguanine synthase